MTTSSATAAVRILPNNKVYRQLFEAQVRIEKKSFSSIEIFNLNRYN
jgi:hypothetical protein